MRPTPRQQTRRAGEYPRRETAARYAVPGAGAHAHGDFGTGGQAFAIPLPAALRACGDAA